MKPEEKRIIIDLTPNDGLKEIKFGMHKIEVRQKMKEIYEDINFLNRSENTECYFSNSLQFTYEKDGTLSFIEIASSPPIYVTILGINTWEISGEELLKLLSKKDKVNDKISEGGYNPIFESTHITLWDLDEQYDHIGNGKVARWGAIGIGDNRYYTQICSLYNK
jgi:hypothetical protein